MMSILPVIKGFSKKSRETNDTVGDSLGYEEGTNTRLSVAHFLEHAALSSSKRSPLGKPPYDLAWYDEMSVPTAIYK